MMNEILCFVWLVIVTLLVAFVAARQQAPMGFQALLDAMSELKLKQLQQERRLRKLEGLPDDV